MLMVPYRVQQQQSNKQLPQTTQPSKNSKVDHLYNLRGAFPHVQGTTTSREVWLSLERAYSPHTSCREYTLKTQLLKLEMKGDETSDAYLNQAKEYDDALAVKLLKKKSCTPLLAFTTTTSGTSLKHDLHNKIPCKLLLSLLHNLASIYKHLPNRNKPSTLLIPKIAMAVVAPPITVGVVVVVTKTIRPTKDCSIGHLIRIQFMEYATDVALVTFHQIAPTMTLLPSKTSNNFRLIMLIIAHNLLHGFSTLVPTAM
ncbi:hypothetical protein Tco_0936497 [Tanacetum coccineum]